MKYIFLFKRTPDIDHLLPIAYSLIKNSDILSKNIYFINYLPDITLLKYKNDKRLIYLNSLGINLKIPKIINLFFFSNFLKDRSKNKFLKYLYIILIKIIDNLILKYYYKKIGNIKNNFKENYKIITPTLNYKFLKKLKHNLVYKNCKLYGVHIGLPLRYLNKTEINEYYKYFDLLDYFLLPLKVELLKDNKFLKKQHKLIDICPSRFDKKWLEVLIHDVYKIKDSKIENKKINLIFFLEKFVASTSDYKLKTKKIENQTLELLKHLKKMNNVRLIIKAHPSMSSVKKNFSYLNKYCDQIYYEDNITSFELIKMSDIVIGTNTSALVDAFLLNKKIIILNYLRRYYKNERNKLVFDNIPGKYIVNGQREFLNLLETYNSNHDLTFKKNNKDFINVFLKDFHNNPMKLISSKIVNT